MSEGSQGRLWVGPLLLLLLVTLIYVFSILPNQQDPLHNEDSPQFMRSHDKGQTFFQSSLPLHPDTRCNDRGLFNETSEKCICTSTLFRGDACDKPVCVNGGFLGDHGKCRCPSSYTGIHCEQKCNGVINNETGTCTCGGQLFGVACEYICMNGQVVNGFCHCYEGYMGFSCASCAVSSTVSGGCPPPSSLRRSSINSRLTLSGLSFCLITIGLLCVSASRRRRQLSAPEESCYGMLEPRRRRRHQPILPVSVAPRQRPQLHLQRGGARPITTPPPQYCAGAESGCAPPTYEEATATVLQMEQEARERLPVEGDGEGERTETVLVEEKDEDEHKQYTHTIHPSPSISHLP